MTTICRLDEAVIPLRTLDPAAPLDDLEWLDDAVGDARVVAIGETAHYNAEFFQLRHRLHRYLAERHGFTAYAMETGFTEGWLANDWIHGADTELGHVMANGLTSLMGFWTELGNHLVWMRDHNRTAERPLSFYGIDMPGSMVSLLPGIDAITGYLAAADPDYEVAPSIRATAATFAMPSAFGIPNLPAAYGSQPTEVRDALTANLADLTAHVTSRRLDYVQRTTEETYERAVRSLTTTTTLDSMLRAMSSGGMQDMMLQREAEIANTVEWILEREGRIVLAAHNGHLQRWPGTVPGVPPLTPLGMHLADRLGKDYLVIGATTGTGQTLNQDPAFYKGDFFAELEAPQPGSLDALMSNSHNGPFAADLRTLSTTDAETVRAVTQQRFGPGYAAQQPTTAYDVLIHLPLVTAATPDAAAVANAPREAQEPFAHYTG